MTAETGNGRPDGDPVAARLTEALSGVAASGPSDHSREVPASRERGNGRDFGLSVANATHARAEELARLVREVWVATVRELIPDPKPAWVAGYDELDDFQKEVDRRIGLAVAANERADWHRVPAEPWPAGFAAALCLSEGTDREEVAGRLGAVLRNRSAGWESSEYEPVIVIPAESRDSELERLTSELEHAKAALAGDSEGMRLWMLDCGRLTEKHRHRAAAAGAKLAAIRRHIEDRAAAFNATMPLRVRPQDIRVSGAAILAIIDRPRACPAEVHNCPDNGGHLVMKDEDGDRVCAAGHPVCRYPLGEHESCPVHDGADTQAACPAGCPDWVCMCYERGGEACRRAPSPSAAPAGPDPLATFRLHVTEDGEIHLACPEGYTPVACMWGRTIDPDPLGGVRATLGDLMAAAKTHTGKAAEEAHREWVRYLEQVETDLDGKGAGS